MRRLQHVVIILMAILTSCSDHQPTLDSLSGTWKSADGAVLEIKKDKTFTCQNLTSKILFDGDKKISGSGKWLIYKSSPMDGSFWILNITFLKASNPKYTLGTEFIVYGKGPWGNTPPWIALRNFDPDHIQRYEFTR